MKNWHHKNIIDLSNFSIDDYSTVIELAKEFDSQIDAGTIKLPNLQGKLITTLFFEPSTRTRSSFELAAKKLSADVHNFSSTNSSLIKGESPIDTALTYISMGTDLIILRHTSSNIAQELVNQISRRGLKTVVLNAGDGLHSHPSQGLLDLYTLANFFNPQNPSPQSLNGKKIAIVGDIIHSRVARSNIWALTACGAEVILCGPPSLLPDDFQKFLENKHSNQLSDPVKKRGKIKISRFLKETICEVDALMTLRLQKERMNDNLITDFSNYHKDYGINHEVLRLSKKKIPILHPGPVNRGVEISSDVIDDLSISLIDKQVKNGISIRMALLYLLMIKGDTNKI